MIIRSVYMGLIFILGVTVVYASLVNSYSDIIAQVGSDNSSELVILTVSSIMRNDGAHLQGQVKNTGENTVSSVKILVSLYDQSGNFLGTESTFANPQTMNPQHTSNFDLLVSPKDSLTNDRIIYRLSIAWENPDGSVGFRTIENEDPRKATSSNNSSLAPEQKKMENSITENIPSIVPEPKNVQESTTSNITSVRPQTVGNDEVSLPNRKVTYLGTIGSTGSLPGKFSSPSGIEYAADSDKLYVSDLDNNRIQIFDPQGHFISGWGTIGSENGQFNHPGDVAVDSINGNIYVSDIENNRIQKFDSNGEFLVEWGTLGTGAGQFSHPGDITVDPSKKVIYVTDVHNNRIQKFDSNGKFLTEWGSEGADEGQFKGPTGITMDTEKGTIFVADTGNNRIQKFDSDGHFIGNLGTSDEFNRPDGITYDTESDLLYVSDRKNSRILVVTEDGKPFYELDLSKVIKQQKIKPRDLALDQKGNVFIVDKVNSKIHVFSPIVQSVGQR